MRDFSTISKVDSTIFKNSLQNITKKICMHTYLKFEIKHVIEYKDKLKDFPIYECVACERLWFRSQTFHLTKTRAQHKYVPCLETTKFELLGELFVSYLYKIG
jgi:hypothetical protein